MQANYKNGYDQIIQIDLTKVYKWMWQRYKWMWLDSYDKNIQRDVTNYTNGYDKAIDIDVTKRYKWM